MPGLGFGHGFGFTRGRSILVSSIKWLLTNVLNLTATVGPNSVAGGTSPTNAQVWDATTGLLIQQISAGEPVSEGMRYTGTEFVNNDGSGNKLHPSKELTENSITSTVFLLYDFRQDSEAVVAGANPSRRYIIGADNHNYALTCSTAGTTHTSPPTVVTADIGSTVAEDGGTVVWDVDHYYSNLADATTNYLPRILNEPAATNEILQSRNFGTTWTTIAATIDLNVDSYFDRLNIQATANRHLVGQTLSGLSALTDYVLSALVKDDGERFVSLVLQTGSTNFHTVTFDLNDGTVSDTQTGGTYTGNLSGSVMVGDKRRIWISAQSTSAPTGANICGAGSATPTLAFGSPTYTALAGEDLIIGDAQIETGTIPSSIIPTTTTTETRDATEFLVTPTSAEFLRMRFADVITQTYLSSGTISIDYDGTTLTVTDGTNAMTHIVAMAVGDQITVVESTGELYYNGSLVDTNGSYSPTWGEIALGNATDYRFDEDLDPTDTTWSE